MRRAVPVVIALLFAGFFFYTAGFGLRTHLGYDDVMNTYLAWEPPLPKLALGLAVPFTTFYRPVGSLVYRVVFDIFGLNPSPFRIVVYACLLLNLFLVYKLARRLCGSGEIAAMSALLYTFHGRLAGIYLNNGTLYDVFCATFTFLTLLYYIGVRQASRRIRGWDWVKLTALFICALNAKEMAGAIPLLLLVYEWLYHKPALMRPASVGRWVFGEGLPALICGVITVVAARYRMGDGPLHGPGYTMTFTLAQLVEHSRKLMSRLVYAREPGLSISQTLGLWAGAVAAAAVGRKKYLWFFLWFALLTPLPVIFVAYRGFFVMYLPLAGWAMFAATLLVEGRNWLWRHVWKRPTLSSNAFEPERIVLFLIAAYVVWLIPRHDSASELGRVDPAQEIVRETRRDIVRLHEPLRPGAKVLFLHDRFPPEAFGPLMMARLLYRDRTISVDRPGMMEHAPNLAEYDCVFDYVGDELAVVGGGIRDGRDSAGLIRPR